MIDQEIEEMRKTFVGMENFTFRDMHVGEMLIGKSQRFFLLSFITLEIC